MSAPADSERKGHKRKLADTFTYSNAVAGNSGGEKESLAGQVEQMQLEVRVILGTLKAYHMLYCLAGETTGQQHQSFHREVPRQRRPHCFATCCTQPCRAQQVRYSLLHYSVPSL